MGEEILNQMTPEELKEYEQCRVDLEKYTKIYKNVWNSAWASRSGVDFSTDINKASQNQYGAEQRLKDFVEKMVSKYTQKESEQELIVNEPKVEKQNNSINRSSQSNSSIEVEHLVEAYINYAIEKYGKEAIGYMMCFMQGNINGITRDRNFRQRFEQYGITPAVVNYICGGDIEGYYNSKIQSSINIDFQEGRITK